MFKIEEDGSTSDGHDLKGFDGKTTIRWGHHHSLCGKDCPCWPECKPERKRTRKDLLNVGC